MYDTRELILDGVGLVCDGGGIISQSDFLVLLSVECLAEVSEAPVNDVLATLTPPLVRNAGFA